MSTNFFKKYISLRNSVLLLQPIQHLRHMLEWLIGTTVWLFAEISLWHGSLTDGEYFIHFHQFACTCDLSEVHTVQKSIFCVNAHALKLKL
jgi:hypothetical protein